MIEQLLKYIDEFDNELVKDDIWFDTTTIYNRKNNSSLVIINHILTVQIKDIMIKKFNMKTWYLINQI